MKTNEINTDEGNPVLTTKGYMSILPRQIRVDAYYGGLPAETLAKKNVLSYTTRDMSEDEYMELFEIGSFEYRQACNSFMNELRVSFKLED